MCDVRVDVVSVKAQCLLIITVGGTIRIHDAGESCPDWPQCFGTWGFAVDEAEKAAYWEANPDQIDSRGADHRYTIFEIFVEWGPRGKCNVLALAPPREDPSGGGA